MTATPARPGALASAQMVSVDNVTGLYLLSQIADPMAKRIILNAIGRQMSDASSGSPVVGNRLSRETSPYLLQHQDNPVHWWAWGPEALAEAKAHGQADPALGRLRRLPLVPRHGA